MNLTWDALAAADRTCRAGGPRRRVGGVPQPAHVRGYVTDSRRPSTTTWTPRRPFASSRNLEKDSEIPPGAKFWTFAHADHLLAWTWPGKPRFQVAS